MRVELFWSNIDKTQFENGAVPIKKETQLKSNVKKSADLSFYQSSEETAAPRSGIL